MISAGFKLAIGIALVCAALLVVLQPANSIQAQSVLPIPDEELRQLVLHGGISRNLLLGVSSPVRIQAKFDTFDAEGTLDGTGSVELLYDAHGRGRETIAYRGQTRTAIVDGTQFAELNVDAPQSYSEGLLLTALVDPIEAEKAIATRKMTFRPVTTSGIAMSCANVGGSPKEPDDSDRYCFGQDNRALRMWRSTFNFLALYDDMTAAAGLKLGKTIYLRQQSILRGKLQVTAIEPWVPDGKSFDVTALGPDPSALCVWNTNEPRSEVKTIGQPSPEMPMFDRATQFSGRVVLAGTVDRTGHTSNLEVVESPSADASRAAMEAVSRWTYKPATIGKTIVPTDTMYLLDLHLPPG